MIKAILPGDIACYCGFSSHSLSTSSSLFLESLAIVTQAVPEHHTWLGLGRYSVCDCQGGASFPGKKMEAQRGLGHCTWKPDAVRFCPVGGDVYFLI